MIERLLIQNQLSFKTVDVQFGKGLIAFSGPSGAGKSVLMNGVLSLFGYVEPQASSVEATINARVQLEEYGLQEDKPNIFKYTKSKSTRYFINLQSVSRKNMTKIASGFVNYLSMRSDEEFQSDNLVHLLDSFIAKSHKKHEKELQDFTARYGKYIQDKERLEKIENQEKKINELKEFARFEIEKIDEVNPKTGEDEELMEFKRALSKKEKIAQAIEEAQGIFDHENSVSELFVLLDKSSAFFDECMNDLRAVIEEESSRLEDLDEINVEELLERIEKISSLKNRYGSIEESLEYRKKKQEELEGYENIAFEKESLKKECMEQEEVLERLAADISRRRKDMLVKLNEKINSYLDLLYMPEVTVQAHDTSLCHLGKDTLHVALGKVDIKKISSGEYNRLRLAFIATASSYLQSDGGVLILDEIDANLSGKESMSVAKVLKELSKKYQIFAISHQPQLSSQADYHFVVTKEKDTSTIHLLSEDERVKELARMVSGEKITEQATSFAKSLLS